MIGASLPLSADVISQNGIEIKAFWIRATPPGHAVSAGYMQIHNHSDRQDKLIAVRTDFAGRNEVHEMKLENDVMKMRPVENGLIIPAQSSVTLEPGGNHLMFMGLKEQIIPDASYRVTVQFLHAGEIEMQMIGQKAASQQSDHHHSTSQHKHSH